MKTAIVSDSNSGIKLEEARELGFHILPTPILIDGTQYFQDIDITTDEFYEKITKGANVTTSQPNPYSAEKLWSELLEKYDEILYFPISAGLSTTCYNLTKVAEQKFNGKVFVIDNKRVSIPMRQSMMDAKKMTEEGKTGTQIKKWLESTSPIYSIYIMVQTLDFLKKSGRLNAPTAFFGQMLKIKPIVQIKDDGIKQYKKVLNVTNGLQTMVESVKQDLETRFKEYTDKGKMRIGIAHTQCIELAQKLKEMLISQIPNVEFQYLDDLSLSVAVHLGPGAIACGCYITY